MASACKATSYYLSRLSAMSWGRAGPGKCMGQHALVQTCCIRHHGLNMLKMLKCSRFLNC